MTKDELIVKQQLEIENYKLAMVENRETVNRLKGKLYAIGAPLNDNVLMFNEKQIKWCFEVNHLVDQINFNLND